MPHTPGRLLVVLATCVALLCAQGWVGAASAVEWPTWPRPKAPAPETAPAPEPQPPAAAPAPEAAKPESEAAAKAGEAAGKKTAGGIRIGTVAKWTLIIGGIAGIAVAVFGGSSGSKH